MSSPMQPLLQVCQVKGPEDVSFYFLENRENQFTEVTYVSRGLTFQQLQFLLITDWTRVRSFVRDLEICVLEMEHPRFPYVLPGSST